MPHSHADDLRLFARMPLKGLSPEQIFDSLAMAVGYRGEVKIEVTFEINTDGIVKVSATDLATRKKTSTTISLSSGLSEAEILRFIESTESMELAGHEGSASVAGLPG